MASALRRVIWNALCSEGVSNILERRRRQPIILCADFMTLRGAFPMGRGAARGTPYREARRQDALHGRALEGHQQPTTQVVASLAGWCRCCCDAAAMLIEQVQRLSHMRVPQKFKTAHCYHVNSIYKGGRTVGSFVFFVFSVRLFAENRRVSL